MLTTHSTSQQLCPGTLHTSRFSSTRPAEVNSRYRFSLVTFSLVPILREKQKLQLPNTISLFIRSLCWHYLSFRGLTYQRFLLDICLPATASEGSQLVTAAVISEETAPCWPDHTTERASIKTIPFSSGERRKTSAIRTPAKLSYYKVHFTKLFNIPCTFNVWFSLAQTNKNMS